MSIEELLEQFDEILDGGMRLPGKRTVVDIEKLRALVDDIRLNIPGEIKQARGIVADRTDIITNAKREADGIIRSAEERAKLISFVSTQRIRVANLICRDVVATGRAPYTNWIGKIGKEDSEIISNSLAAVGMISFADRAIDTLSDGEFQRIMIARALAQQTPIILLDEPTAFLDIPTRFEICRLLADLAHNQGKTILFSTHDIDAALTVCDSVAIMDNASISVHSATDAADILKVLFSL